VLEFAAVEADAIRHRHIGIEHLLLGLLREDRCGAALSLAAHGVRLSDVRRDVEKLHAPLDGGAKPIVLFQIEAIKRMVKELANAPQGSKASADLVARICASLDNLNPKPGG
jgi:ATP-dependent Clp protease ATP-binding subunit ClpA